MINHLYVHIPFCKYICTYCDFTKKYIKYQDVDLYLKYLEKEFNYYQRLKPKTIYIGGGTPSALTLKQLEQLLIIIQDKVDISQVSEWTIEMNPDDINEQKLQLLQKMNVNRVSVGVQTFNDKLLQLLKREHTVSDVIKGIEIIKKYIDNISIDLIYNLPNQSQEDIKYDLNQALKLPINHISYYSLIMESNTILELQKHKYLSDEFESQVYQEICQTLNQAGFEQYEISNFAKDKCYSKHNMAYWNVQKYLGIGLGASGYYENIRYTNTKSLKEYYAGLDNLKPNYYEKLELTNNEKLEEKLIFGLRTNFGVSLPKEVLDNLKLESRLSKNQDVLKIKPEYYYQSNEIIVELLLQLERLFEKGYHAPNNIC